MLKLRLRRTLRGHCCAFRCWAYREQRGKAVWAGVAQLVEHLICNQRVGGSNPFVSSSSIQHGKDLVVLPDRSGHADLRSLLQGKKTRSIRGSD